MPIDLDQGGRIPQINRTYLGPSHGWILTDEPTDIEFVMDGAGATPLVGNRGFLVIPQWVTIVDWLLIGAQQGSIVVDIWKAPLSAVLTGHIMGPADSICGGNLPTLSNQSAAQGSPTNWNTLINQNDVLAFNINSVNALTQVSIILQCVRLLGTGG